MTTSPDKLHLGCGSITPPTWLNVDGSWAARLSRYPAIYRTALKMTGRSSQFPEGVSIYGHDLRKPLPWAQGTFSAVYASHLLEHLHYDEADRLLKECFRVLRPGGLVRMVVPDLDPLIRGYLGQAWPSWTGDYPTMGTRADDFVQFLLMRNAHGLKGGPVKKYYEGVVDFHSHKWMYNAESLCRKLESAGFVSVRACGLWESQIPDIKDVELEVRVANGTGAVAEGAKPG